MLFREERSAGEWSFQSEIPDREESNTVLNLIEESL
jgi:hypothetical protein